jgi:hypothetical protein
MEELCKFGFYVKECFFAETFPEENPSYKDAYDELLHLDFRKSKFIAPFFDPTVSTGDKVITGPVVLQVSSVANISQPAKRQHEDSNPRLLLIKLTDGHTSAYAMEYEAISTLSTKLPPGTKIKLSGETKVCHGKLLLTPSNVSVLGGCVDHLLRAWQTNRQTQISRNKKGSKGSERQEDGDTPPDFEMKIDGRQVPAGGTGGGGGGSKKPSALSSAAPSESISQPRNNKKGTDKKSDRCGGISVPDRQPQQPHRLDDDAVSRGSGGSGRRGGSGRQGSHERGNRDRDRGEGRGRGRGRDGGAHRERKREGGRGRGGRGRDGGDREGGRGRGFSDGGGDRHGGSVSGSGEAISTEGIYWPDLEQAAASSVAAYVPYSAASAAPVHKEKEVTPPPPPPPAAMSRSHAEPHSSHNQPQPEGRGGAGRGRSGRGRGRMDGPPAAAPTTCTSTPITGGDVSSNSSSSKKKPSSGNKPPPSTFMPPPAPPSAAAPAATGSASTSGRIAGGQKGRGASSSGGGGDARMLKNALKGLNLSGDGLEPNKHQLSSKTKH